MQSLLVIEILISVIHTKTVIFGVGNEVYVLYNIYSRNLNLKY